MQVGFARGQLSAETRKLLRRELGGGGQGGRPVALTPIPHLLPCDPEDPATAEQLLDHTGGPSALLHSGEACLQRRAGTTCILGCANSALCISFRTAADMFATHRGGPAAFAAARPQLVPHAAAALQLAIHHLLAAQAAQHVLPPCSLVCADGLLGGARDSGKDPFIADPRGNMRPHCGEASIVRLVLLPYLMLCAMLPTEPPSCRLHAPGCLRPEVSRAPLQQRGRPARLPAALAQRGGQRGGAAQGARIHLQPALQVGTD